MSTFGAPIYAAEPEATTSTTPSAEAPQEVLDPNDPRLTSEALDVNTIGDAYAVPAPPPDARYRAKLKIVQVEDASGGKHDYLPTETRAAPVQACYYTRLEARIIDPTGRFDNIPVYDYWVGTYLQRDGSTKVSTILARLRQPSGEPWVTPGTRQTQKQWMDTFVRALAGEPEIGMETQWGWSCQLCGEAAEKAGTKRPREILGMHKFPQETKPGPDGKPVRSIAPEMKCGVNPAHGFSRAQLRIARFLALSELK